MQLPQPSIVDLVVPVTPYPWKYYTGVAGAIPVIDHFAKAKGRSWAPLPLSMVPTEAKDDEDAAQRALARQVIRAQNEVLMRLVSVCTENMPTDPTDAVARLIPRFTADKHPDLNQMFGSLLRVDMYSRRFTLQHDNVLDVRDYGLGLGRYSLLDIFEPTVPHACAFKHRLMAQPSYEHAQYTLVASRQEGQPVAITIVWRSTTGDRCFYLVGRDGGFPTLDLTEEQFPVGTLIRHIGFSAPFYNSFKENSVQGALDRILPGMSFPVATFYHDLGAETPNTQGRLTLGSMQRLVGWVTEGKARHSMTLRTVADQECQVHRYEFMHPDGSAAGNDALRHHCRPTDPVLFIQDGQTIVTAGRPPQLEVPMLIIIDVSRLPPTKLQRLRSDRPWRNELVREALNRSRNPVEAPKPVVEAQDF